MVVVAIRAAACRLLPLDAIPMLPLSLLLLLSLNVTLPSLSPSYPFSFDRCIRFGEGG